MNNDNNNNNNTPGTQDENYEELLKNFLPSNEHKSGDTRNIPFSSKSGTHNTAGSISAPSHGSEHKQGIYFSQTRKKDNEPAAPAIRNPAGSARQYPPVKQNNHVLIPPEQSTARISVPPQKPQDHHPTSTFPASDGLTGFPPAKNQRVSQNTTNFFPAAGNGTGNYTADFRHTQQKQYTKQTAKPVSAQASAHAAKKAPSAASKSINSKAGAKEGSNSKKYSPNQYNKMVKIVICLASVALIIGLSVIIKIPIMGCVNDILAIDGTDDEVSVTVAEGMSTKQIIKMLGQKGLIYSPSFCNMLSGFLGYDKDTEYPAGTYTLTTDMGVEGMLAEIVAAGKDTKTVTLTFPEGYTVEQIIARLAGNGVASTGSLYAAMSEYEFTGIFEHLNSIKNSASRFSALEGYLYPDTYEFYIGENPNSVIRKFLANFESKWMSVYSERAEELGRSMEEILTIASILEKEAKDEQQMPIVASVLYNRLGEPGAYPHLECDSTTDYVEKLFKDGKINDAERYSLLAFYDTYQINGLPEGPICNPGGDAIKAALNPDSTDFYYFLHDKNGDIYLARTADEHAQNALAHAAG